MPINRHIEAILLLRQIITVIMTAKEKKFKEFLVKADVKLIDLLIRGGFMKIAEKTKPKQKQKPKQKNDNVFNDAKIKSDETRYIETYLKGDSGAMKIFFRLYKGYYGHLILSSFLYIIEVSFHWIVPLITANLINLAIAPTANATEVFIVNIAIALFVYLINIPAYTMRMKHLSIAKRSVEAGLRGAMVRKLQHLSISFHKEMETGKIHSKVMRDVENIETFSVHIINTAFDVVLTVLVTSAIILSKNVTIFIMFLVAVPIGVLSMVPFRNSIRKRNKDLHQEIEKTSSNVMDMVELIPVTRSHALEDKEINKMNKQISNVAKSGYKLDVINSFFVSSTFMTMSIINLVCLAFCVYMALNKKISVGDISIYTSYFSQLLSRVNNVIAMLPIFTKGIQSINSIGEILRSYDIEEYKNKKKLRSLKGEFKFQNIFFHYADDNRFVLKDFSLEVKQGETIALVGESGSGKSTIVNMAIGLFTPTSGEIYIDGKNMKDLDMRSFRKRIAVVPQNTILFNGTIKDNITYGKPGVTKEELEKAIEAANLTNVIAKLPNGLNTDIGEHGGKLSGGQRQRISIARAIIRNPDVIIFDEATSALDTVSEAEIQSAINNLTKDRTTFIVAHRLSTIRTADKIAVMQNGTCVEYGTYDELMEKKGEFYKYKITQS